MLSSSLLVLLWLLIFGPDISVGLTCYINATSTIDCDSISLHLADYHTPACLLFIWKENLTAHQSCFYSRADSPLDESCRLISDSSGGSEEYSLWRCLCGASGCNNVSVISSLDRIRVNVNRSSVEIRPTSTVGVNYSTTEIDGYQEQVFHYGLSPIYSTIAIWTGVLIVVIVIVATIGAFFRWVCLHHKKPKSIEQV